MKASLNNLWNELLNSKKLKDNDDYDHDDDDDGNQVIKHHKQGLSIGFFNCICKKTIGLCT